jgi:hypothetical protein
MTASHTPAPWAYDPHSGKVYAFGGEDLVYVAQVLDTGGREDPAHRDGDGRVIALAPSMAGFVRMLARLNASGDDVEGTPWEHDTGDSLDTLDAIVMHARQLLGLPHDDRASIFHEPRGEG